MWQMLILLLMSAVHSSRSAPPSLREKRQIETKYGGWRPILPGSPFFFGGARSLPIGHGEAETQHPQYQQAAQHQEVNFQAPPQSQHHENDQQQSADQQHDQQNHYEAPQPLVQHEISVHALRPLQAGGQAAAQHEVSIQALPPLPEGFHQNQQFEENRQEAEHKYPQSPVPDKDIFSYYPPPTTPQPFKNHNLNRPLYVERAKKPFEHPFGKNVPVLEIGIQTPFNAFPVNIIGPHGENFAQSTIQAAIAGHHQQGFSGHGNGFEQVGFFPPFSSNEENVPQETNQDHNFQQIGEHHGGGFHRFPEEEHAAATGLNGFQHQQVPHLGESAMGNHNVFHQTQQPGLTQDEQGLRDVLQASLANGFNQQQQSDSSTEQELVRDENRFQQHQFGFGPQGQGIQNQGQPFREEIKFQQIGDSQEYRPDDNGAYQTHQQSEEGTGDSKEIGESDSSSSEEGQASNEGQSERDEDKYHHIRDQSVFHNGPQINAEEYQSQNNGGNDQKIENQFHDKDKDAGNHHVYDGAGYHQEGNEPEDNQEQQQQMEDQKQGLEQNSDNGDYRPHVDAYRPQHLPEHYPREQQTSSTGHENTVQETGPEYVHFPEENRQQNVQLTPPSTPSPVYRHPTHHEYAVPMPTYSQRLPPSYEPPQVSYNRPQVSSYNTHNAQNTEETRPHHQRDPQSQSSIVLSKEVPNPQQTFISTVRPPQAAESNKMLYHSYTPVPPAVKTEAPYIPTRSAPSSASYFTTYNTPVQKKPEKFYSPQQLTTHNPYDGVQYDRQIPSTMSTSPRPTKPPRAESLAVPEAPTSYHVYGAPKKELAHLPPVDKTPSRKKESSIPKITVTAPPRDNTSKSDVSEVIHMSPGNDKKPNGTQVYHAYYAPADHKAPPGYVRLTVSEFNKMFNNAEIQYVGAESKQNGSDVKNDKPKVLLSGGPESNKIEEEAVIDEEDDGPVLTLDLKPGQSVEDALSELGTINVGGIRVDASQLKEGRDFEVVDVSPVNSTTSTTKRPTTVKPPSLLLNDGKFGERIKQKKS